MHHLKQDEDNMMQVRQHPTLSAKDAYAVRAGYNSQRGASVIIYSKKIRLCRRGHNKAGNAWLRNNIKIFNNLKFNKLAIQQH